MSEFLVQASVYLAAAVICVPVAKRLGMGSVLGYLAAGIVIGPFLLGLVGQEGADIMHFAEFGVVMMLFLVGLELEPAAFWRMRRMVTGAGTAQVTATMGIVAAAALSMGMSWQGGLAVGAAAAMSSTAIALQSLKEKQLLGTAGGQQSFAVLLFQDIAVIPILALLPLLASTSVHADDHGASAIADLPAWMQTLTVLAAVGFVIAAGRWAVVPLLRAIARTRLRELFTAASLLIVVAIALVMQAVGLSAALGTFLAGVVLATSEFKHELESDLDPFKGLLLGLFFMGVGASIDFSLIAAAPGRLALLTIGVMATKVAVLLAVGRTMRLSPDQNLLFAIGLAQVGEFAFVLLSFSAQLGILAPEMVGTMMAVTALSMTITPLMMLATERVLLPGIGTRAAPPRAADVPDQHHPVIIAGFSHFGSTVGRFLRANGVAATILDNDSDRVDLLRRMGFTVYYGDVSRHDLLEAAGGAEARILVVAVEDPGATRAIVETARKHFPNLRLMVRARHRFDAYDLMELGVTHIYRQHLDTSIRMGVDVLRGLGHRAYTAYRSGQQFLRYDEAALARLAAVRHNQADYIVSAREQIAEQEALLLADREIDPTGGDHAWDSEEMRTTMSR